VKLLFDENLSSHLVDLLADCYPGSCHVRSVGLERADDSTVWDYAAAHGLTIVSKDSDFHQRSLLFGAPPKVVWIHIGNCSTSTLEQVLRGHVADLERLEQDSAAVFLILD
jgi:predicted nuclease of predicted toxin-antitoxin system